MFPVTITLNNADQLNAVLAAMNMTNTVVGTVSKTTTKTVDAAEKKSSAVTDSAATDTTAATNAAQEQKAGNSVAILDKDALTAATKAAIAKAGRDEVVALIASYGAAKGSEIATEKRAEFDAKLLKLAA
jgi:hypothetical protein